MRILSYAVFAVLQIALLPVLIPAWIFAAYKQIVGSRRLGVSQTGVKILSGRWVMHVFGIREDEAAGRLQAALPNCSHRAIALFIFPLWVQYKLSGHPLAFGVPEEGEEKINDLVTARTLHIDRMIRSESEGLQQLVLLGAGYDTRAYGPLDGEALAIFELDRAQTQRVKVEALRSAGIDTTHVTFVPVDFETERFMDRLLEAGFDVEKKSLFLWEGVTLYLSQEDVRETLRQLRAHAPAGTSLIVDFYGEPMARTAQDPVRAKALELTGESFAFILDFQPDPRKVVEDFVTGEGLTVKEVRFQGPHGDPYGAVAHLSW